MPTTFCVQERIGECPDSPKSQSAGMNSSKTRTFEIYAMTDAAAYTLLRLYAPATDMVDGIPLEATPVYKLDTVNATNSGLKAYKGTVEYKHAGRDEQTQAQNELIEPEREKVTCSFSGVSTTITQALSQQKFGPEARDVQNNINVQYNGEVDGTDINVRQGAFTISTVIRGSNVDNDWFKARFEQVWTVNQSTFRSWPPGCVALAGMDARQRADGNWEIDYQFQIQPPESVTEIGQFPLGTTYAKEGFEYAWVMIRPSIENTGSGSDPDGVIVPEVVGAYMAKLYAYSDFSQLGIQT